MSSRHRHPVAAALWLALLAAGTAWTANPGAFARTGAVDRSIESLRAAAGPGLEVDRSRATGLVRFMSASKAPGIRVVGSGGPDARALEFVDLYGAAFGLDRRSVRVQRVSAVDGAGMEHVRLQQTADGIPVAGGEAIVHLRGARVASVLARTVPDLDRVATTPDIAAATASEAVRGLLAKHLGIDDAELSSPRLEIFNPSLLDGGAFRPSRLAWFVEARTFDRLEYVWVDAKTGAILLNFNQMPHARNRLVYDAGSESSLPGSLTRSEGEGATGDTDTDNAYDFSGDTYDYYWTEHGRDSYDDAGASLVSTVHYCPETAPGSGIYNCNYANAFWSSNLEQMVYSEGFASADDVVAHELTHAVTEYTAGLYYFMQPGALNESFSDIFGETVDQTNEHGSDDPEDMWLMGEDLPEGEVRDMQDPNTHSQPGKMSDPLLHCNFFDNAGVHFNSGIPNHAYVLMVDGGTFNDFTVTGIGLTKAAAIHYRVLTQYLTSGSDFNDFYNAANQACNDLVGELDITVVDCTEVDKALRAVEMDLPWACIPAQSSEPDLCGTGETAVDIFFEDVDSSEGEGWEVYPQPTPSNPNCYWALYAGFSTSGFLSFRAPNSSQTCGIDARMSSDITIPASGAKLRFNHAFGFGTVDGNPYDGGFIMYSTNSGVDWQVADCSSCEGLAYNGTLVAGTENFMAGETGFTFDSFVYRATQLDLGSLAGQDVRFGFRISTDSSGGDYGWWLDDIRIFECVADGSDQIFSDDFESDDTSLWSSTVGGP